MRRSRAWIGLAIVLLLVLAGGGFYLRGRGQGGQQIPVLLYHHIYDAALTTAQQENPWAVSTEAFEAQMRYLYDNGFHTLTHAELAAFLFDGSPLPENSVLIHFDDGYYSNFVYAYPILQQFGQRATVFMITGMIEELGDYQPAIDHNELVWTAAHTLVGTEDVFELASHSHAMHHLAVGSDRTAAYLASREELIADTHRSFDFLNNHTAYAYPRGQYNEGMIEALREVGITMAFTITDGYVTRRSDPFRLERFTVFNGTTMEHFQDIVNRRIRIASN